MSGTNRLINSENTIRGNSQEELKRKLGEANEVAEEILDGDKSANEAQEYE